MLPNSAVEIGEVLDHAGWRACDPTAIVSYCTRCDGWGERFGQAPRCGCDVPQQVPDGIERQQADDEPGDNH